MALDKKIQKQLLTALIYFVITVLLATVMQWNMADIAWSIWASSFILAFISLTAGNVFFYWLMEIDEHTEEQKASPHYKPMSTEGNIFSCLYMFFLQLVPFILLNSVVVMLLNEVLPFPYSVSDQFLPVIEDSKGVGAMMIILFAAIKKYFLFLLITLCLPIYDYYLLLKQKMYKEENTQTDLILNPYYDVFKIQGLMLVLMILSSLGNDFLVYWVLLFFYFFPWSILWDLIKAKWNARKNNNS